MNIYSAWSYIKYSLRANNRHGIHSPFVYALIDQVLLPSEVVKLELLPVIKQSLLPDNYLQFIERMIRYFNYNNIVYVNSINDPLERGPIDVLWLNLESEKWLSAYHQYRQQLHASSVIIIAGIYKSKKNTAIWRMVGEEEGVTASIDLYYIGLLFYRKEIKQQQQFTLCKPL